MRYQGKTKKTISEKLIEKLARAIHSRYQRAMHDVNNNPAQSLIINKLYLISDDSLEYMSLDFNELPENIKTSNIDNARHIPEKLLSIGYSIREKISSHEIVPLLYLSDLDIETMAIVEHERWMKEKLQNGFSFSPIRDDNRRLHPCLVPYNDLLEIEKDKDRELVRLIPHLLRDIEFIPVPIGCEEVININFPLQSKSQIIKLKHDTESLIKELEAFSIFNNIEFPNQVKKLYFELKSNIKEIEESIFAACKIQRTFLPSALYFRECLPESFLFFKPKDILSGDFYFISRNFEIVVVVAADCTGHGIEGAMLSAICYNFIDQAVNNYNIIDPAEIIEWVMPKVENIMRFNEGGTENKKGLEFAVCTINTKTRELLFAGINRPLFYISKQVLYELESTKYLESFLDSKENLKTQKIHLHAGDVIYIFSDGYTDQLGGLKSEYGKKFLLKQFRELLLSIQNQNMSEQREILNQRIEQWRQEACQDQTDDILVIGVRL